MCSRALYRGETSIINKKLFVLNLRQNYWEELGINLLTQHITISKLHICEQIEYKIKMLKLFPVYFLRDINNWTMKGKMTAVVKDRNNKYDSYN